MYKQYYENKLKVNEPDLHFLISQDPQSAFTFKLHLLRRKKKFKNISLVRVKSVFGNFLKSNNTGKLEKPCFNYLIFCVDYSISFFQHYKACLNMHIIQHKNSQIISGYCVYCFYLCESHIKAIRNYGYSMHAYLHTQSHNNEIQYSQTSLL